MLKWIVTLLVATLFFGGCAFAPDSGPFTEDPFAEDLAEINFQYKQNNWLKVPTGAGNVIGATAFAPVAIVFAPFEWMFGNADESPVFTGTIAFGSYVGGFILGTPPVLIGWTVEAITKNFGDSESAKAKKKAEEKKKAEAKKKSETKNEKGKESGDKGVSDGTKK